MNVQTCFKVENDARDGRVALILPHPDRDDVVLAHRNPLLRHGQPGVRQVDDQPWRRVQKLNLRDYARVRKHLKGGSSLFRTTRRCEFAAEDQNSGRPSPEWRGSALARRAASPGYDAHHSHWELNGNISPVES